MGQEDVMAVVIGVIVIVESREISRSVCKVGIDLKECRLFPSHEMLNRMMQSNNGKKEAYNRE
jgi:hypothetical protein